jgi:hypothetical protein
MFTIKTNIDNGIPLISVINNETPVAPPSIKLFDNKNPFKPKEADNTPNRIRK